MQDSRAWRHALILLVGTTLLRLALGAVIPLFPDETYYWDWSRTLMPGYFDHPPMIAGLIRAGTLLFGHTPFGVRVFPILAGTGAALGIALTARTLAGDTAAWLATLVFTCMPLAAAGFVLATPDAPLLCAVAWALYAVVRALQAMPAADAVSDEASTPVSPTTATLPWWSLAGLCVGLAMASKYTAVLVPAAIALACLARPALRRHYATPGPYVAVLIASLVLAPVLWWNATHSWISFAFQFGHGLGTPSGGPLRALNRELELIGGQVGLVSPILFFFVTCAVYRALRLREAPGDEGYASGGVADPLGDADMHDIADIRFVLGAVAIFCLAFFMYSATRRSVEANWPALAWLPAVVLLAITPPVTDRAITWLRGGLILGGMLAAVIYVHVVFPILPLPASRDQVAKAFGWQRLAAVVDGKRHQIADRPSFGTGNLFIGADRYQDASELAFHLSGHPRVFSLNLTGRPNQYDLWQTFPERAEQGVSLLLVLDDHPGEEPLAIRKLACCFVRIDQGERVPLMRRDQVITNKRLWLLSGWTGGWPEREQPFSLSSTAQRTQ